MCVGFTEEQITSHGDYPISAERLLVMVHQPLLFQDMGPIIRDSEEFVLALPSKQHPTIFDDDGPEINVDLEIDVKVDCILG